MSQLVDAISESTAGTPVNEHSDLGSILAGMVHTLGSGAAAARALGVSPTTFYRWRNAATGRARGISQQPKAGRRTMVAAIRRAGLKPDKERAIRSGAHSLKVKGWVRVSKDRRLRTIDFATSFSQRDRDRFLNAWLSGDDERADRALTVAIDVNYVEDIYFDQIEWARYTPGGL